MKFQNFNICPNILHEDVESFKSIKDSNFSKHLSYKALGSELINDIFKIDPWVVSTNFSVNRKEFLPISFFKVQKVVLEKK